MVLLQIASVIGLIKFTVCSSPMPKVFVDVESIEMIDPLKRGLDIVLKRDFVTHYLDPVRMPTIYLSVIPLNTAQQSLRLMYYREEINYVSQGIMNVKGLAAKSWYYVCLEFENVIRVQNRGNTSTDCRMVRTLNEFGRRGLNFVNDIRIISANEGSLEFAASFDVEFQLEIMTYLEDGSQPVLSHVLSQPSSLPIHFHNLEPGRDYGRLCFLYRPTAQYLTHTMLGRSIHFSKTECFFESLLTKKRAKPSRVLRDELSTIQQQAQILKGKAVGRQATYLSGPLLYFVHNFYNAVLLRWV